MVNKADNKNIFNVWVFRINKYSNENINEIFFFREIAQSTEVKLHFIFTSVMSEGFNKIMFILFYLFSNLLYTVFLLFILIALHMHVCICTFFYKRKTKLLCILWNFLFLPFVVYLYFLEQVYFFKSKTRLNNFNID